MPSIWKLKKGMDRRFRAGHSWVYSNELSESPKGIEPGELIRLQDAAGQVLALGYGNPKSLIAFRALVRGPSAQENIDLFSVEFLTERLHSALSVRIRSGNAGASFRLCFGEADFLPGLVIDRYLLEGTQCFVVQAHTAGADRMLAALPKALEKITAEIPSSPSWAQTAIVYRNDLGVRGLEGLKSEFSTPERIIRATSTLNAETLSRAQIRVAPSLGQGAPVLFRADLIQGQKTGFFLDQAYNISVAAQKFRAIRGKSCVKILDLCCYVGQWSTQLARVFHDQGVKVEVTAFDASQTALDFARENIEREGAKVFAVKGDVLKDLQSLDAHSFDLVISDPPALIKSRKDIPAGKHAYLQLNTQAFRLARPGGAIVSCSCSGLLEEEDFLSALSKAAYRNQAQVRWIARGSQASDHPMLVEFPEGRYLKSWFGLVGE